MLENGGSALILGHGRIPDVRLCIQTEITAHGGDVGDTGALGGCRTGCGVVRFAAGLECVDLCLIFVKAALLLLGQVAVCGLGSIYNGLLLSQKFFQCHVFNSSLKWFLLIWS